MYHPARDARRIDEVRGSIRTSEGDSQYRIMTIPFDIEDENDALDVAEDLAILEDAELIYLSMC